MIKRITIILSLFIFLLLQLNGQDVVFTRFGSNPLHTSAALTGAFQGKYRVGTSIRRQWIDITKGSLYSTKTVFADMRINIVKNDYLSLGILLFDDISGSQSIKLGTSTGIVSMSYSKHLYHNKYSGQNQYLAFGIQFGCGKRYFDDGNFLFGIQFDKNTHKVNPNLPSGEPFLSSRLYPDINTGLFYYISGKNNSFYIGGNIKHINRPDISLIENTSSGLYMLYMGLVGGEYSLNNNISLLPSAILNLQGSYRILMFGNSFRYQYSDESNAFRIGTWLKFPNSINGTFLSEIAFTTGFEFNGFELGLSYDITVSELINTIGNRGAFELSLAYFWGINPKKTLINCPRF